MKSMKKIVFSFVLSAVFVISLFTVAYAVPINTVSENNTDITADFADNIFLQEVRKLINKTNGEPIYISDVVNIEKVDMIGLDICSFAGIEYFIGLKEFNCYANEISELDMSNNKLLEILDCSYNMNMTSLNVSKNTELKELHCNYAQLETLDISNNKKLTKLICFYNNLSSLDISNNQNLQEVKCSRNYLTQLDVSNNIDLTRLECTNNLLTSTDSITSWQEIGLVLGQTFKFDPQRKNDVVDISDNYMTEISNHNNKTLYKFTPKTSDEYIFSSKKGNDLSAVLYTDGMRELIKSENIEGDFKMKFDVDKDKKYYVKVSSGSATVPEYQLYAEPRLRLIIQ